MAEVGLTFQQWVLKVFHNVEQAHFLLFPPLMKRSTYSLTTLDLIALCAGLDLYFFSTSHWAGNFENLLAQNCL